MRKPILCSVNTDTGVWTDDEGREWVPAKRALPEEQHAVILWENGAYLPQVAIYDVRLGWRFNKNEDDPRWLDPGQMQDAIDNSIWTRYVPERRSTGGE